MEHTSIIARACGLFIATGSLLTAAQAQGMQPVGPPEAVTTAFNKAFPNAMDVEWKQRGTQYKVEFETGVFFTDHEAWYDATGKLLRHEEEISVSDLPAAVTTAVRTEFPGYTIDDAERITVDGVGTYVVELELKGQPDWKVAYDAAGKQVQKTQD